MADATIARATRRQTEREGQAIDLVNYTGGDDSEFGETRDSNTTVTTVGVITPPSGNRDPDQFGIGDVDLAAEITIPDDGGRAASAGANADRVATDSDIGNVTDGAGRLATRVDVDQDGTAEYVVAVKLDRQNGSLRLDCTDTDS